MQKQWHSSPSPSQEILRSLGRVLKRKQGLPVWTLVGAFLLVLLFLNWQLVVATLSGIAVMGFVYLAQDWNWQRSLSYLQKFQNSPNRQLTVAVATGASAVLVTYMVSAIWSGTDDRWLASASILQLLSTLTVLFLLARQAVGHWFKKQQMGFDQLITGLTASDDLERLIAVRQLEQFVRQNHLPFSQEQAIAEYCRVLLGREPVIAVRDAALETLEALNYTSIVPAAHRKATD